MAVDTSQTHAFARSDRSFLGVWWWTMDRWLFGAAAVLVVLGILLSFGNSPAAAARMNFTDPFHFAIRPCAFAVVDQLAGNVCRVGRGRPRRDGHQGERGQRRR